MKPAFAWLERRGWVFLLALAGILFLHGTYIHYDHARQEPRWDVTYEYNERLPSLPKSLEFSEGTKLTLTVFLPAGSLTNRVRYLAAVDRVHKRNGLRTVAVVPGNHSTAEWYQQFVRLPFEIIGDEHLDIHMAFRVSPPHGHTAVALFDGEGRVKFHAFEIPEEDEVRQVVEKYLLGQVDYEYRTRRSSALVPGQPLPVTSLKFVAGVRSRSSSESLDASERILVFLPRGCSSCQMGQYSSQIFHLSLKAQNGGSGKKGIVVVFPDDPDTTEWNAVKREIGPVAAEFWVTDDPSLIWDEYYTRYLQEQSAPLVVGTDAEGRVEFAKSLGEILEPEESL